MYYRINNRTFEDANWNVLDGKGELQFKTSDPLSELEQEFDPENAVTIEEYDDEDNLVASWFNRNLYEIGYVKQDGEWLVTAKFGVSEVNKEVEAELLEGLDDSDDAIMELAAYIAWLEDEVTERLSNVGEIVNTLSRLSGLYDALADRVARLENKEG